MNAWRLWLHENMHIVFAQLWITLSEKYVQSKRIKWEETVAMCFSDKVNPDDESLGEQIIKVSSLTCSPSNTSSCHVFDGFLCLKLLSHASCAHEGKRECIIDQTLLWQAAKDIQFAQEIWIFTIIQWTVQVYSILKMSANDYVILSVTSFPGSAPNGMRVVLWRRCWTESSTLEAGSAGIRTLEQ